jgi:hypothetical protein
LSSDFHKVFQANSIARLCAVIDMEGPSGGLHKAALPVVLHLSLRTNLSFVRHSSWPRPTRMNWR